jgi:hypothetical protein
MRRNVLPRRPFCSGQRLDVLALGIDRSEANVPIFRYFLCAGSVLVAALFAVGGSESSAARQATEAWTSTDSLRSMAHHGETRRSSRDWSSLQTVTFRDAN